MPAFVVSGVAGVTRWLWWLLAWMALGLGLVGIVVPGLPTVPFVLLSAYAASRIDTASAPFNSVLDGGQALNAENIRASVAKRAPGLY